MKPIFDGSKVASLFNLTVAALVIRTSMHSREMEPGRRPGKFVQSLTAEPQFSKERKHR
jgi:hypothetical protein